MRRPGRRGGPSRRRFALPLVLLMAVSLVPVLVTPHAVNAQGVGSGSRSVVASPEPAGPSSQVFRDFNVVTQFPGLRYGYNNGFYDGYSPPDPQLAVGPTEVVEMVNVHEQIFTKSGASLSVVALYTVFNVPQSDDIGDPRIVYDNSSGRFFASVFDWTTQDVLVAVSLSSTVDAGWFTVHVNTASKLTGVCPDQPYIGVTLDKVVVTANDYAATGPPNSPCRPSGSFQYQVIWYVNKADVLALQQYPNYWYFYYSYSTYNYFGFRPVSSPTSTAYLVCTTCGNGVIVLKEASGAPTQSSPPTITTLSLPFASPQAPPPAPHLGNASDLIDTNSAIEVQSAAWTGNGFWFTLMDGCVPVGDNAVRSCIRLVQVSLSPTQVVNSFDVYGPPGLYLFFPAITSDSYGNIGLVAGYSNSTLYPGVLVTGMKSGAGIGSFESNLVFVTRGTGYSCHFVRQNGLCRYGDYFGAAPDPADPSAMWFIGEYETSSGWATSIAAVRVGLVAVTVTYSIQDGSTAPRTPVVSYTRGGAAMSGSVSPAGSTFYMDLGTSWTVSLQLGGTSSERWGAQGNPGGQATQDGVTNVVYYHQYLVTPSYTVSGGGSGFTPPSVTCAQFGSQVSSTAGAPAWVDAGSSCVFARTLPGSSGSERWAKWGPNAPVSGSGTLSQAYYHQFLFTLSYSVSGGGSPAAPTFTSAAFGSAFSATVAASPSGFWVDSGGYWTVESLLGGSSSSERWATNATVSGSVTGAGAVPNLVYQHQYYLSAGVAASGGGTQAFTEGWYSAGATVYLSAQAASGWRFESWSGTGGGAQSGSTASLSFVVSGPANETALFYPGLTITATGSGSVEYTYGTSSGKVDSGGNVALFAPLGTTLTLKPVPSSFLYAFTGWSGALSGASTPGSVQLSGPSNVTATFGLDYTTLGVIGAVVLLGAVGVVFFVRRRSTHYLPPPPPAD